MTRCRRSLAVALLSSALTAFASASAAPAFRSGVLEPAHPAPDFALTATDGSRYRLRDQRGRIVVLVFGYTFCADVCPLTLSEMVLVRDKLGDRASRVQVVFVTLDPERDTPERLRTYVGAFDRRFVGLTGDPESLARMRKAYGVVAEKRAVAGTRAAYLVDHSAFVSVIDAEGRLRLMFPFGTSVDDMTHDIKLLLGG